MSQTAITGTSIAWLASSSLSEIRTRSAHASKVSASPASDSTAAHATWLARQPLRRKNFGTRACAFIMLPDRPAAGR